MPQIILAAITVLALLIGLTTLAGAQGEMEVLDESVEVSFGESLFFSARLILPDEDGEVTLFIRPREGFRTTSTLVEPGITGRVRYTYDLGDTFFPPFSTIEYWYQWEGTDGETLISPTFTFEYVDNRFNWRMGAVSIMDIDKGASSDIDGHTKVGGLLLHRPDGDRLIDLPNEPGHQELCDAEQAFVQRTITEDSDLTRHMQDAVRSLAICLAADESIRTGRPVQL